jgi:hypothetical protein
VHPCDFRFHEISAVWAWPRLPMRMHRHPPGLAPHPVVSPFAWIRSRGRRDEDRNRLVRALAIAFVGEVSDRDECFAAGSCTALTVAGERLAAVALVRGSTSPTNTSATKHPPGRPRPRSSARSLRCARRRRFRGDADARPSRQPHRAPARSARERSGYQRAGPAPARTQPRPRCRCWSRHALDRPCNAPGLDTARPSLHPAIFEHQPGERKSRLVSLASAG